MCGLDIKSILRMLMINKPTKLSKKEQNAICLEEAMREVFLNRSLNFNEWRDRFLGYAKRHHLTDSAYLRLYPEEKYVEMWAARKLDVWGITMDPSETMVAPPAAHN
jgi:hypothetical protein